MNDTHFVLAIENAGEFYYVSDDEDDLLDRLNAGKKIEVLAGQCEGCGSFNENGEPGPGYIVRRRDPNDPLRGSAAFCGCCERERAVQWHLASETVF